MLKAILRDFPSLSLTLRDALLFPAMTTQRVGGTWSYSHKGWRDGRAEQTSRVQTSEETLAYIDDFPSVLLVASSLT